MNDDIREALDEACEFLTMAEDVASGDDPLLVHEIRDLRKRLDCIREGELSARSPDVQSDTRAGAPVDTDGSGRDADDDNGQVPASAPAAPVHTQAVLPARL